MGEGGRAKVREFSLKFFISIDIESQAQHDAVELRIYSQSMSVILRMVFFNKFPDSCHFGDLFSFKN